MVVMMVQILDNFETWWWVESEEGFPRVFLQEMGSHWSILSISLIYITVRCEVRVNVSHILLTSR